MVVESSPTVLNCFKAYDIRGQLGKSLNKAVAYRIGRAYGQFLVVEEYAKQVVVGCDCRLSSPDLKAALSDGIMDAGLDVIDLGLTGTEEVYFATCYLKVDGGVEVTASHNPMDYNGMKLVRGQAKPISGDTGLKVIRQLAEQNDFLPIVRRGKLTQLSCLSAYVDHLLTYIEPTQLRPLKLVVNSGNGVAGSVIDELETNFAAQSVPVTFVKIHHQPDGSFPNGIPNPLLPERRMSTVEAVLMHNADIGIAWDGDFDRCFLFDEHGQFVEGYYIVGLLAEVFLHHYPEESIVHDPRLCWNTQAIVEQCGGKAIQSKTGHAFMKECMRSVDAIYGGEMSAHHYFRDFAYCDSGMIPWLLVIELLSVTGKSLSELVAVAQAAFPCSGELNFRVDDVHRTVSNIEAHYIGLAQQSDTLQPLVDKTDGLSMAFDDWRFNLRGSNTEPLLRLNVESRNDRALMESKTAELKHLICEC